MKMRIFLGVLLAGSVLATPPAMSAQRKTLFEVLFPNIHQERMMRQQRIREQRLRAQRPKVMPRVQTSKNYAYKVVERSRFKLVAIPTTVAAISTEPGAGGPDTTLVSTKPETRMTRDIELVSDLSFSTESHLATTIRDHYGEKQSYIWLNEAGEWNAKARSVQKLLKDADGYGLRDEDYLVEDPQDSFEAEAEKLAENRLRREVSMTNAVLRYAMDASFGTINPNRLSGYHDFPEHYAQSGVLLDKVIENGLPANNLRQLHPSNEKFAALRQELQALQGEKDDVIELKRGTFIKPGQSNEELPSIIAAVEKRGSSELLAKHSATLAAYPGDTAYTAELVALVRDYQKEAGLGADGIVGKKTLAKLTGISSGSKIDRVLLAMERLRWLPHQLGDRHVFINQPEYRARYIESGSEKLSMRVVVGKKSNQTNFFYDEIEHIEYNPYWNVPRSIIVNEFLPKSLGNPGYLNQRGYEVRTWGGKRISSTSVNWYQVGTRPKFAVRQPPGPRNALGELKIMFPNKHAIYMHDTPSKNLFNRQDRAFSHGCIRLHDPRAMAAAVMGTTKAQIGQRVAQGKNLTEKLPSKVPVYVSYFTAWPQEDGSVKYFSDMYGRDSHLMKAIEATRKARATSISL